MDNHMMKSGAIKGSSSNVVLKILLIIVIIFMINVYFSDNKVSDDVDSEDIDNKVIDNKVIDNKIIDNKIIDNKIIDNKNIDNKVLPSTILMTINLGTGPSLKYKYFDLTLHSMQHNNDVDFILIHVIDDDTYNSDINFEEQLISEYNVQDALKATKNFRIHRISYSALSKRIKQRLNIDVHITDKHYYKMSEFKPTLAVLFSEFLVNPKNGLQYQWWGYADNDLIWGKISNWSHLFLSSWHVINTGWESPRGMCTFYRNLPWLNTIYLEDPMYLILLRNITTHDLDENGLSVPAHLVINNGQHSINIIQKTLLERKGLKAYHGPSRNDRLFIEKIDSVNWAGPVRWFQGSLKMIHSTSEFPSPAQYMYYHRADDFDIEPLDINRTELIQDMLEYGYLLPYFTPLLTRFACTSTIKYHSNFYTETTNYKPYICLKK